MATQQELVQGRRRFPIVWRGSSIVFCGLGIVALLADEYTGPDDWDVLGWICALTLVYAIFVLYRGFRDGAGRVLTDPFLILVGSFCIYFLFGTLLLVIGPEDQAQYVLQWYPTSARDALRVTGMNLVGLSVTLFAAGSLSGRRIERSILPAIAFFGKFPVAKIFWLFLIVGVAAKLRVVSFDISNNDGEVVLGTIRTLAGLVQLAILVGILYQGRGAGAVHLVATTVAAFDSATGLLLFNKSATLMPVVVLLLGLYLRRPSLKLIVVSVAIISAVFVLLVTPISEGRLIFDKASDTRISERLQIIKEVLRPSAFFNDGSSSWTRLCYTVAQVAAVDLYDNNQGGEDMELLAWAFVPRAVAPNKPIMTRSGTDFNAKVTGSDRSSSGMGLFVSGYYNLGWSGLVLASVSAGWILSVFAAISRAAVASGSMVILPIGLLGSFMAFRIDGHFIADYLGPFAMVMVPFLVLLFMLRVSAAGNAVERMR